MRARGLPIYFESAFIIILNTSTSEILSLTSRSLITRFFGASLLVKQKKNVFETLIETALSFSWVMVGLTARMTYTTAAAACYCLRSVTFQKHSHPKLETHAPYSCAPAIASTRSRTTMQNSAQPPPLLPSVDPQRRRD